MNILFVGPYRQPDGWGMATRSYIKALATKHKNITTRPVYLATPDLKFDDEEIISYENSLYDNYDVVIQKTLPHCLFYNGSYKKNIGFFELETNNLSSSDCITNINRMDEVWVPSSTEEQCLIKSGVKVPIRVVSQPLDTEFIQQNKDYKIKLNPLIDNMFKFYFIGDNNDRKNITDLVVAFNLAFDYTDPVCLVIKTNNGQKLEHDINEIKKRLGNKKRYKKEIIISDYMSYKDIIGLHNYCDCFIAPSYGEAFCRPAAEALVLGKTPIINKNTGMKDYINDSNGFLVKSHRTPVIVQNRPLSTDFDIYNADEYWYKIDIYDLVEKMKLAYDMHTKNSTELLKKKEAGISSLNNFSYDSIGSNLCI
jgi:glycosyltransferase involved in cell wall biosynthesis